MSELPQGILPAEVPEPRESASAIVLREAEDGAWDVLLGLRSRRSRFMPGHLAFPGGGLDAQDEPSRAEAHRRCVRRELQEETGLEVPADAWHAAGERITPPLYPVRFRTLFFVTRLPRGGGGEPRPVDGENELLRWARPRDVLEEWNRGESKVPPPVLTILRGMAAEGAASPEAIAGAVRRVNAEEQRAPRIEFAPGVWMLPVRTATLPPATHTNVWMPGGTGFVIIDPGSTDGVEQARLLEVIERRRALGHEPLAVILTHHHRDHIGGARAVATALGLPLWAHGSVLDDLPELGEGLETRAIDDEETIELGGLELRALHTPGHARGHLALLVSGAGLLIAGDLVSGLSTILIDPVQGDMGAFLESLERCRRLDCRMLLPGHGPPLPGAQLGRVIAHRRQREARLLELLEAAPGSLADLARQAYAEEPGLPVRLTETQTRSHLLHLERTGRARREDPAGERWSIGPSRLERIREILLASLQPSHVELRDDSAMHVGHAGATSGGGHYHVLIVSPVFEGRTRLEQHRLVNEALRELIGTQIHALGLKTYAPSEWAGH